MGIDIKEIQKLREQTGAGIADVKEALETANGDVNQALEELKKKGAKAAAKRADRETTEGIVHAYIHSNKKVGAMISLGCETDFVARNEQFEELANDLALHIVAMQPEYVKSADIPQDVVDAKKEELMQELKDEGKPEDMIEKIVEGKLNKWYQEICLMDQKFVKNDEVTINEIITDHIGTMGEKIEIHDFSFLQI